MIRCWPACIADVAPEILMSEATTLAADVYAFGVLLHEVGGNALDVLAPI